jgi:hypothetical protein
MGAVERRRRRWRRPTCVRGRAVAVEEACAHGRATGVAEEEADSSGVDGGGGDR